MMIADANYRIFEIKEKIIEVVAEYKRNSAAIIPDTHSLDPIQFEHYFAEILRSNGWDARVTQASGDQGINIIATRGNVKAVFLCKKYSQPVGNGEVQEIVAGKQYDQADIAAVVSNAMFTPSAKQLAGTTGVHLLHCCECRGLRTTFLLIARRLLKVGHLGCSRV